MPYKARTSYHDIELSLIQLLSRVELQGLEMSIPSGKLKWVRCMYVQDKVDLLSDPNSRTSPYNMTISFVDCRTREYTGF